MSNVVTVELPDDLARQLRVAEDGVADSLQKLVLNTLSNLAELMQSLQSDDSTIRSQAAKALGEMGAESAAISLAEALRDKDAFVRYSAAVALQNIGTVKALKLLREEDAVSRDNLIPDPDYAPLLALAGALDIGTTDLGENHDFYIAEELFSNV